MKKIIFTASFLLTSLSVFAYSPSQDEASSFLLSQPKIQKMINQQSKKGNCSVRSLFDRADSYESFGEEINDKISKDGSTKIWYQFECGGGWNNLGVAALIKVDETGNMRLVKSYKY